MDRLVPFAAALVVLIAFSAFFSCSETAFFSLTRVELGRLRRASGWAARQLVHLLRRPRDTLICILLGNEVVNCAATVVAAQMIALFINDTVVASIVTVATATPLVLTFGEVIPKNLAVVFAPRISPVLAVPMAAFVWITTPVRRVLTAIADTGVRLVGGDPTQVRSMIFEEEFRQLVDMGAEAGALSRAEREWIHGVFHFSDATVRQIMTPADQVFRIPLGWPLDTIVEEARQAQYSRIPVYHEDPTDIVGLLYVRDLVTLQHRHERGLSHELEEIVRPVLFVRDDTRVEELLREFQRTSIHMAVVRDDRQQVVGVATLEDVLATLIGERD